MPKLINCSFCDKVYHTKKAYYRHARLKHPSEFTRPPKRFLKCHHCGHNSRNKPTLRNHIFREHKDDLSMRKNRQKIVCAGTNCDLIFSGYKPYYSHLEKEHDVKVEEELHVCDGENDFEEWKKTVSPDAPFVKDGGTSKFNNKKIVYYRCHRSYTARITSGKRTKYQGSVKIGKACPAQMRVEYVDDKISIRLIKTHFGHTFEKPPMTKYQKRKLRLAGKLPGGRQKKPENRPVNFVPGEDADKQGKTSCPVKKRRIDPVSMTVQEIIETDKEVNPVLFYKKQTRLKPSANPNPAKVDQQGNLKFLPEDFVLIVMTSFQEKIIKQFGQNAICIDYTQGLGDYNFSLYSLAILDEFGSAVPVAFCISNRADAMLFKKFFSVVKERVGVINSKAFVAISDGAEAFYDSWQSVMGPTDYQLSCWWHIFENWTDNASKISDPEKRTWVKYALRGLLREADDDSFFIGLGSFLRQLLIDPNTKDFGLCFQNYYLPNMEQWALCFKKNFDSNLNTALENLHKRIERQYLLGLQCLRLDVSVQAIFRLINDERCKRMIKTERNKLSKYMSKVVEDHNKSINVTSSDVEQNPDNTRLWVVKSNERRYEVMQCEEPCSETNCLLKCNSCNICVHSFVCNCMDNVVHFNVCEHIHAVNRLVMDMNQAVDNDLTSAVFSAEALLTVDEDDYIPPNEGFSDNSLLDFTSSIHAKVDKIKELILNRTFLGEHGMKINRYLDKFVDLLASSLQMDEVTHNVPPSFIVEEVVNDVVIAPWEVQDASTQIKIPVQNLKAKPLLPIMQLTANKPLVKHQQQQTTLLQHEQHFPPFKKKPKMFAPVPSVHDPEILKTLLEHNCSDSALYVLTDLSK